MTATNDLHYILKFFVTSLVITLVILLYQLDLYHIVSECVDVCKVVNQKIEAHQECFQFQGPIKVEQTGGKNRMECTWHIPAADKVMWDVVAVIGVLCSDPVIC